MGDYRKSGPGPNQYNVPGSIGNKNPTFKRSPTYSLGRKAVSLKSGVSPSPAEYNIGNLDKYKPKPPHVKMQKPVGGVQKSKETSPGPGAYNPTYNTSKRPPKFAFGIRPPDYIQPYFTKEDKAM